LGLLHLPRPIRAIAFDFDGVLVESLDIKAQAFAELYRPYGESVMARVVDYHQRHGGMSRYEKFRHFHREFLRLPLAEAECEALGARFSGLVEAAVAACPWVPGALEFLRTEAARLPCYVVSATPTDELRTIVEQRGATAYFRGVFGTPESKPDILRRLRGAGAGREWLMVGDTLADYEAAEAAGMQFLGRLAPRESNPFPASVPVVADLRTLAGLVR